jgi:hypothetical protein
VTSRFPGRKGTPGQALLNKLGFALNRRLFDCKIFNKYYVQIETERPTGTPKSEWPRLAKERYAEIETAKHQQEKLEKGKSKRRKTEVGTLLS